MTDYEAESIANMMQDLPVSKNSNEGTLDLQGINHTVLHQLATLTNLSVNGDAELKLDAKIGGAGRFRQTVTVVKFLSTGDYFEIDLGSAEDWTAGNAEDDYLTFFMRALEAFANTEFDLELRNGAGALITNADYAVPAYTTGLKPQFVTIDTSGETLDAVQYIRIVYDGDGEKDLWLWDFIRTDASCIDDAKIIDLEALHGGKIVGEIKISIADNTGGAGHFHRNSLASEWAETIAATDETFAQERLGWIIIHGVSGDASVTLNLITRSR